MTSLSLAAYAGGLLGLMGIRVLAPAYFARQEMHTPVRVALVAVAVNGLVSLALMGPLGHVGLALATTLAAFANAALLLRALLADGIYRPASGWGASSDKGLAAALAMGLVLRLGVGELSVWVAMDPGDRAMQLVLWILAGAAVYGGVLLATGVRPWHLLEQRG